MQGNAGERSTEPPTLRTAAGLEPRGAQESPGSAGESWKKGEGLAHLQSTAAQPWEIIVFSKKVAVFCKDVLRGSSGEGS